MRGLAMILGVILFLAVAYTNINAPYDSTDNAPERSGLVLHTDNLTGCQYLSRPGLFSTTLTPRLDTDGLPMCRRIKQ